MANGRNRDDKSREKNWDSSQWKEGQGQKFGKDYDETNREYRNEQEKNKWNREENYESPRKNAWEEEEKFKKGSRELGRDFERGTKSRENFKKQKPTRNLKQKKKKAA